MSHSKVMAASAFCAATLCAAGASAQAPAPAPAPAPATASVGATATAPPAGGIDVTPAENPDLGDPGAFVIDQISGFRARVGGGVQYYGPVGFAYNSFSSPGSPQIITNGTTVQGVNQTETTVKSYSIWLAPSLDYFLVQNLSIGGLFAVDTQWGTATTKTTALFGAGQTNQESQTDLPNVTSFTLIPRVGYLIRINDRLSFWPRVGIGYFHGSNVYVDQRPDPVNPGKLNTVTTETTISSLIIQLDVGIIYQITDNVFFRIAPQIGFSNGGSGTVKFHNAPPAYQDQSGEGSAFTFEVTSGFGANFSLL